MNVYCIVHSPYHRTLRLSVAATAARAIVDTARYASAWYQRHQRAAKRLDLMPLRPLYPTDTERHISIVKLFVQKRYLKRRRRRRPRANNEIAKVVAHFQTSISLFLPTLGSARVSKVYLIFVEYINQ